MLPDAPFPETCIGGNYSDIHQPQFYKIKYGARFVIDHFSFLKRMMAIDINFFMYEIIIAFITEVIKIS